MRRGLYRMLRISPILMSMSEILKIGLEGMQRGMSSASQHAQKITDATYTGDFEQVVEGSIELHADVRQVQASAKVIKVGDKLLDETLSILA